MGAMHSIREYKRYRAIELLRQGESPASICHFLDVSRGSLWKWQRMMRDGESLASKPIPGPPRRLNEDQLAHLEQLLSLAPTEYGWPNDLWTTRRVADLIYKHFREQFCLSEVWRILTKYLGWKLKRPIRTNADRNEIEIGRWKAEEWPRILAEARRRNAYLAIIDESGFMMTPTVRRSFVSPKSVPVNRVTDAHGRISVIGSIVVSPIRRRMRFFHHCLPDNQNFHGETIAPFLQHLRRSIAAPMIVLWDGITIHSSAEVDDILAMYKDISVEKFPPGAPELDPVDAVWFYVKYDALPNYAPHTMHELRHRVDRELAAVAKRQDLLESFLEKSELVLDLGSNCILTGGSSADKKPQLGRTISAPAVNTCMRRKYLACDIEVARLGLRPGQDWRRVRPLGLSCAATFASSDVKPQLWHGADERRPTSRMRKQEVAALVHYLLDMVDQGFTILTWNGLGFDLPVLAEESAMLDECRRLAGDHVDMMFHLVCQLGYGVSLDCVARGMGVKGKAAGTTALMAPRLWANGEHQRVLKYVAEDARITLDLCRRCQECGYVRWISRQGAIKQLALPIGWLTVNSAIKLPHPKHWRKDNAWSRNRFMRWLQ